jgi:O-antigen/teichoic acid export membrane protein
MTLGERLREAFGFSRLIAGNIGVKAVSEVLVKAGRFLLVVVAARMLGPEGFGLYMFAFAFGNILANASDFGLQMYLSREVARGQEDRAAVLGHVIRAKQILVLAVGLLLVAVVLFYPRPAEVRRLLLLAGIAALLQSWNELWNYFFRGIQSLRHEAGLNLANMVLGTGLGIGAIWIGWGVAGLFWALIAAGAATTLAAIGLLVRRGDLRMRAPSPPARRALSQAAPIGVAILLSILYFRIDVVFLERMRGDEAVGTYGAAYKILESLLFLPAIFLAAIYPAFSESARLDPAGMRRIYCNSLRWMLLLSSGIVAVLLVLAPLGLEILYGGRFGGSVVILRILAPSLLFIFVNYALTHFLVALEGQRWNALFAAICVAVNAGLNFLVIPRYGAAGAAATTVITEATLFVLCFRKLRGLMAAHDRGGEGA